MESHEMALNDGKTVKLLSGKGKSLRLCTSLYINRKESVPSSFSQDLLRMRYKCACASTALASFHF